MVFAQSYGPTALPNGPERIILIQDKAPAAKADVPAPAADAKIDAKDVNGNGKDEEKKDDEKKDEGPWRLFPDEIAGFKITGWVYGGGIGNTTNGGSRYNGPMTMQDQNGVFLDQLYLDISRGLKEELSWGATFSGFYGNDYNASQSRGFELRSTAAWLPKMNSNMDYGLALPQEYFEVGTTKYSLKVGHFWTPIGYMVVQAPNNFFNSQPYGFMMTNPFTHWGAMASAAPNDHWSGYLGVINGWDALDRPSNTAALLFGFKYTADEKKWFYNLGGTTGKEPSNLTFPTYAPRTLINQFVDINVSEKVEFVFESNMWFQQNPYGPENSMSYNFHPLLFYKINNCWRAGIRYEYFHDPDGVAAAERIGNPNFGPVPQPGFNGAAQGPYHGNFQTVAAGLNWSPNGSKNLMVRPEIRYDWFQGQTPAFGAGPGSSGLPFNAGASDHQFLMMLNAFYLF